MDSKVLKRSDMFLLRSLPKADVSEGRVSFGTVYKNQVLPKVEPRVSEGECFRDDLRLGSIVLSQSESQCCVEAGRSPQAFHQKNIISKGQLDLLSHGLISENSTNLIEICNDISHSLIFTYRVQIRIKGASCALTVSPSITFF